MTFFGDHSSFGFGDRFPCFDPSDQLVLGVANALRGLGDTGCDEEAKTRRWLLKRDMAMH